MSPATRSEADRRVRLAAVAALVGASLLGWWLVHRFWFMSSDDYLAISRGGRVGGAFGVRDWWDAWWDDWNRRNGRTSDSVLRLVLRPGPWLYPLLAPIMLTGAGVAAAVLIGGRRRELLGIWAAGLTLMPAVLWFNPAMSGDAVFWTAGAMNYVLPLALLTAALIGYVKLADGETLGWARTAALGALVVVGGSLHESAALALAAAALVVVVVRWGRWGAESLVVVGVTIAAFVVHMSAPGLWNRAAEVPSDDPFLVRTWHNVAIAGAHLWQRSSLIWLGFALLLVAVSFAGWASAARGWLRAAGTSCLLLCVAALAYLGGGTPSPRSAGVLGSAVVVCLAAGFTFVAVALLRSVSEVGVTPLLSWAAFVGSSGFMLVAGLWSRAHFMVVTLMALSLLCLLAAVLRRGVGVNGRLVWGLVAALMASVALMWGVQAHAKLQANRDYVRSTVLPALEAARAVPDGEVAIPNQLPFPDFATRNAFNMKIFGGGFRIVFGIDPDVKLVNR